MLRTLAIAIIPVLLAATPSAAVTSQEKMETCKVGAESQQLQGAKRSAFIKKCMAGEITSRRRAKTRRNRNRKSSRAYRALATGADVGRSSGLTSNERN